MHHDGVYRQFASLRLIDHPQLNYLEQVEFILKLFQLVNNDRDYSNLATACGQGPGTSIQWLRERQQATAPPRAWRLYAWHH